MERRRAVVRRGWTGISRLWLILCPALSGFAQTTYGPSSETWFMMGGNPQHSRAAPCQVLPDPVTEEYVPLQVILKWSTRIDSGDEDLTPPVVGPDGTVFVGDYGGYLHAINPDGTQKWRVLLPGFPVDTVPAVDRNGTVYIHLNGAKMRTGIFAAIEKLQAVNSDGSTKWTFLFNDGGAILLSETQSSPAIGPDGTIYVGSMDTRLWAIDPETGNAKWCVDPGNRKTSIKSSPAVAPDGTVYVYIYGLYAYTPEGNPLWACTEGFNDAPDLTPVVDAEDGTILVGARVNPDGTFTQPGKHVTPTMDPIFTFCEGCVPNLGDDRNRFSTSGIYDTNTGRRYRLYKYSYYDWFSSPSDCVFRYGSFGVSVHETDGSVIALAKSLYTSWDDFPPIAGPDGTILVLTRYGHLAAYALAYRPIAGAEVGVQSMDFERVTFGESADRSAVVRSMGKANLEIANIHFSDQAFSSPEWSQLPTESKPIILPPGEQFSFTVRFTPSGAVNIRRQDPAVGFDATCTVYTNALDPELSTLREQDFEIALTGIGLDYTCPPTEFDLVAPERVLYLSEPTDVTFEWAKSYDYLGNEVAVYEFFMGSDNDWDQNLLVSIDPRERVAAGLAPLILPVPLGLAWLGRRKKGTKLVLLLALLCLALASCPKVQVPDVVDPDASLAVEAVSVREHTISVTVSGFAKPRRYRYCVVAEDPNGRQRHGAFGELHYY